MGHRSALSTRAVLVASACGVGRALQSSSPRVVVLRQVGGRRRRPEFFHRVWQTPALGVSRCRLSTTTSRRSASPPDTHSDSDSDSDTQSSEDEAASLVPSPPDTHSDDDVENLKAIEPVVRRSLVVHESRPDDFDAPGSTAGVINWYPGHIAKAERELTKMLKLVDVVVEARDARLAATTAHPDVAAWVGAHKQRVVAYTFSDQLPRAALNAWKADAARRLPTEQCFFVDAKLGGGDAKALFRALRKAADAVNAKRKTKGLRPRAARCAVIGFPNVGKSALVNRLVGRRVAKSENRAGVTRQLTWLRQRVAPGAATKFAAANQHFLEILDSPGIIPAKQLDQRAAARLAMCGEVGDSSYDARLVAEAFIDQLLLLPDDYRPEARGLVSKKLGKDFIAYDAGADFLEDVAWGRFAGDASTAAAVTLANFRNGKFGPIALEPPPSRELRLAQLRASDDDRKKFSRSWKNLPHSGHHLYRPPHQDDSLVLRPRGVGPAAQQSVDARDEVRVGGNTFLVTPPGDMNSTSSSAGSSSSSSSGNTTRTDDDDLRRRVLEGNFDGW